MLGVKNAVSVFVNNFYTSSEAGPPLKLVPSLMAGFALFVLHVKLLCLENEIKIKIKILFKKRKAGIYYGTGKSTWEYNW